MTIEVLASERDLAVRITDQGGGPVRTPQRRRPTWRPSWTAGRRPRGWGLFLIKSMVDAMHVTSDEIRPHHRAHPAPEKEAEHARYDALRPRSASSRASPSSTCAARSTPWPRRR